MKKCPKCKMTVDESVECPFCKTSLVYEPEANGEKKYKLNKYFFLYLLKKCCFSLVCFAIVFIRFLITFPKIDMYFFLIVVMMIISMAISVEQAFFKKDVYKVYCRALIVIILSGLLAVVFSFIMW